MASERKRRKVIHAEGRAIIAKVFHFLKDEYKFTELYKEPHCDLSHLRNISRRTAEAVGTSQRTVQKILQEERNLPSGSDKFPSPLKNRQKRAGKVDINERIAYTIRSSIRNSYVKLKQIPTLKKVRRTLNEQIGYDACLATIRKLLLKLGYTWTKSDTGRKVLIERHDVQMCRLQYLKKITEYRSQGRPIVYTDESYVTTKNVKCGSRAPHVARYILAHAGTSDGFIENACLLYQSLTLSGDDYSKKNFDFYQKWLDEKLLPNLPDRSVVVLDSTSFDNIFVETLPTMHASKSEMEEWLSSKNISFEANLRQIELYDIIRQNKRAFTTYKIDNYIKSKGFEVLRLPPHHPELHAILNIWDTVKSNIVTVDHDVAYTEKIIRHGVENITCDTWRNTCDTVIKKENEYMEYFDTGFVYIAMLQDESEGETASEPTESEGDASEASDSDESTFVDE
ncbi:uncharacterized protein LOC134672715 [Cydia fagiglandana]|uniref:uncharacterized protein LOC134672715 n=1 Tax=Cydia fagiglandana TaxID=1458189 RepID=UPI002FEE1FD9